MKHSYDTKIFVLITHLVLGLTMIVMLLPYVKIIAESLSSSRYVDSGQVLFWPKGLTLNNYRTVLGNQALIRSYGVTLYVTAAGTLLNLLLTALFAYPLSRPQVRHKKFFLLMVTLTIIFPAPLIPRYLLVRGLGLLDSLWALMLPVAMSGFNFFIMRTFFVQLPQELFESANLDGASELRVLMQIVIPLSKPVMASMGLFYAVYHWNSYFLPMMFIRNPRLYTLQVRLRLLLESVSSTFEDLGHDTQVFLSPQGIQMASIIVVVLPILALYPILQKYFAKGVMLGSVKG